MGMVGGLRIDVESRDAGDCHDGKVNLSRQKNLGAAVLTLTSGQG
jgi:hypothetical protein